MKVNATLVDNVTRAAKDLKKAAWAERNTGKRDYIMKASSLLGQVRNTLEQGQAEDYQDAAEKVYAALDLLLKAGYSGSEIDLLTSLRKSLISRGQGKDNDEDEPSLTTLVAKYAWNTVKIKAKETKAARQQRVQLAGRTPAQAPGQPGGSTQEPSRAERHRDVTMLVHAAEAAEGTLSRLFPTLGTILRTEAAILARSSDQQARDKCWARVASLLGAIAARDRALLDTIPALRDAHTASLVKTKTGRSIHMTGATPTGSRREHSLA